jgi:ornithine carbamoyltransferase
VLRGLRARDASHAQGLPLEDLAYAYLGDALEAWDERIALLKPYAVTADVMRATGKPRAKFVHCLSARCAVPHTKICGVLHKHELD